ncbi:MAG: hypothetical protein P8L77_03165 [Gammaproteobacteria bacterium]|nr:hypothetical protein [Gammaproteobacteria bacterium]
MKTFVLRNEDLILEKKALNIDSFRDYLALFLEDNTPAGSIPSSDSYTMDQDGSNKRYLSTWLDEDGIEKRFNAITHLSEILYAHQPNKDEYRLELLSALICDGYTTSESLKNNELFRDFIAQPSAFKLLQSSDEFYKLKKIEKNRNMHMRNLRGYISHIEADLFITILAAIIFVLAFLISIPAQYSISLIATALLYLNYVDQMRYHTYFFSTLNEIDPQIERSYTTLSVNLGLTSMLILAVTFFLVSMVLQGLPLVSSFIGAMALSLVPYVNQPFIQYRYLNLYTHYKSLLEKEYTPLENALVDKFMQQKEAFLNETPNEKQHSLKNQDHGSSIETLPQEASLFSKEKYPTIQNLESNNPTNDDNNPLATFDTKAMR